MEMSLIRGVATFAFAGAREGFWQSRTRLSGFVTISRVRMHKPRCGSGLVGLAEHLPS